jgi:bifunctional oligoribonuclease and PAP phosphatase NrnA
MGNQNSDATAPDLSTDMARPFDGGLAEWPAVPAWLRTYDDILCVSHVAPDGDAVGSLLGLGWMLRSMGKRPTLALPDPVPENFRFLPGADEIVGPQQVRSDYDLIVSVDLSSLDRMGSVYRPDDHGQIPLLVIDHHVTNTGFGHLNWVAPDCAAACQMLVYLADALDVALVGPLAACLLTGVVTDTLCFRTNNTNAHVLEAAMRLVRGGADLPSITAQTLNRMPYHVLKLWGRVLSRVRLEEGVIWVTISHREMGEAGSGYEDGGLSGQLITVREADISASFTEKIGENGQPAVECSFRAKPGFDVSAVAFSFGGGGHPPAAGCTLAGRLDEVSERVVAALKEVRRRHLSQLPGRQIAAQNGDVVDG